MIAVVYVVFGAWLVPQLWFRWIDAPVLESRVPPEGNTIVVLVHHPECSYGFDGPARLHVQESPESVTITARVPEPLYRMGCSSVFGAYPERIVLDEALGDETLRDAEGQELVGM